MPVSSASQAEEAARDYAAWQQAVAAVLAKSRKVDVAELPADPEHLLDTTTYDGVTVAPLYTRREETPEAPLPGVFPFVRGRDAHRDVNRGWLVSAPFGAGESDPVKVNEAILDGLENGISALWLRVGGDGLPVEGLAGALAGVLLDLAPLTLDAGAETAAAAERLYALLDERAAAGDGVTDRAAIGVNLGASPLTDRFSGAAGHDLAGAVALAGAAAARVETVRALTVDGTAFHNAGASDAEELDRKSVV